MLKVLVREARTKTMGIPFFLTRVVAVFFCGIKPLSMNENIRVVTGNDFFKMFKKMLFRVKAVIDDLTEVAGEDDEPKYD